jgi:hypothetical protein
MANPSVTVLTTVLVCAVLQLSGLSRPCLAQVDNLAPTRSRLTALLNCLGPDGAQPVDELARGLLEGWGEWQRGPLGPPSQSADPSPPPKDYLDSLDQDIKACDIASGLPDQAKKQGVIDSVVRDIVLKAHDCQRFGMARDITVRVVTLKGTIPDNGWTIFYKWICASGFDTEEMSFPQVSSPSVAMLPAGEYSFRAEKRISDSQVLKMDAIKVTVSGQPSFDIQITAP